jgi:glycosyltransferase involved in cell wall biosynthesis
MAARLDLPTAHYVFDDWLVRWRDDPWYTRMKVTGPPGPRRRLKRRLREWFVNKGWLPRDDRLEIAGAQFASGYLRRVTAAAGLDASDARVVPFGVDLERFPFRAERPSRSRLLFVGRLHPEKGPHTLIRALSLLRDLRPPATLAVVGSGPQPVYVERLKSTAAEVAPEGAVRFVDFTDRAALPEVYRSHDTLVFPSSWDEPFGITLIEAMASGTAVVATGTGGSGEIVRHEENALVFTREDPVACAEAIPRLVESPELFDRLRARARADVERDWNLEACVDKIEAHLETVARTRRQHAE